MHQNTLLQRLAIPPTEVEILTLYAQTEIDLREILHRRYTLLLCDSSTINAIRKHIYEINPQSIGVVIGCRLGTDAEVVEQITLFDGSHRAYDQSEPFSLLIEKFSEL